MSTWILILFAHTGVMSSNDSNSLTTAIFATEQHCTAAGEAAKKMAAVTTKVIKYSCTQSGLDGRGFVKEGK
jgi:maleate cis-trans isomerase